MCIFDLTQKYLQFYFVHTSGATYGGVPQHFPSGRSLPLCRKTVEKPKSVIFKLSTGP